MLPFVSLDAATAVGPGVSRDLEVLADHHTMVVRVVTGGGPSTSATVVFEGSHDGSIWVQLASVSAGITSDTSFVTTTPATAPHGALVRYVRANLAALSGGTNPTVTATIASDITQED